MTFLLDHDVPIEAARLLRREGHTALRIVECLPVTTPDAGVFAHAKAEGWFTVTCNRRDFLPLAEAGPHPGLILLIRRKTRQAECAHLLRLLRNAGESGLAGNVNFA
jgi:predicted nuclease of predicted toxin-antitoxin system